MPEEMRPFSHRELRRKGRELNFEQTLEVIAATDHAVLSTVDEEGYPYGVPISPVFDGNHLYFHATGLPGGHKEENMLAKPYVTVTFISKGHTLANCYSVDFASAIVKGRAFKIEDEAEKERIMDLILKRHAPFNSKERNEVQKKVRGPFASVWRIDIDQLTGKARAAGEWVKGKSATMLHDTCTSPWLQGVK